jgi:hypothetical protein
MKKLTLLFMASLLLACQQSNVSETDDAEANATTGKSNIIEQKNEMSVADESPAKTIDKVIVQSVKANQSSLQFTHTASAERAQIGVPYEIDITFLNASDSGFTADFSVTPGMDLISPKRMDIQAKEIGDSDSNKITVIPQKEGIHFLNIYKVGAEQQKPSAIKIIVGEKDIMEYMESVGEVIEQEDGSKVISMKADESN